MSDNTDGHYRDTIARGDKTRFTRCGYQDRFDPFRLSRLPRLRALYKQLFQEFLGDIPVPRILDIGCGTGIYFEALSVHGRDIHVLDASCDMLRVADAFRRARGLDRVFPAAGAAETLPYPADAFDLVVALDALHHVRSLEATLGEVHRVLKPGGQLFVFEPNVLNPLMWCAHALPREERLALRRNRPATLRAALETHFDTLQWRGVCALITETTGLRRRLLDACTAIWRWTGREALFPRQAWLGVKRR